MRILLVQPACYHGDTIHHYMPPLGIAYLAAVLIESGFEEVKLIDFYSEDLWQDREKIILDYSPDIVGISSMTMNFPNAVKVAKFCKENLQCLVVYGGPHPTGAPESPLRDGYGDVSVMGYGEKSLLSLCRMYEKKGKDFKQIPNIWFKNDRGEIVKTFPEPNFAIDEVPLPARKLLDMEYYPTYIDSPIYGRIDVNTINASRGCNFKCIFCTSRMFGHWEGRNPEGFCDEIELLEDEHPQKGLFFYDLLFTLDKKWVTTLCQEMIRRGLNRLKWYAMGRTNVVTRELLELMGEAGCVLLSYGVEGLVDETLKKIGKSQRFKDIEAAIRMTSEAGITPMGHFIVGLPGQKEEDLWEELKLIEEWIYKHKFYAGDFYPMMVLPGSKLYSDSSEFHEHNWIDEISPDFVFKNIPIYANGIIPRKRLLELSDELNKRCRELLASRSSISNIKARKRRIDFEKEN